MKQAKMIVWMAVLIILVDVFIGYEKVLSAEAIHYPERDIVCIVPSVPGGTYDIAARASAQYLRKYLPKQVNILIQNVPGAGERIGSFQVYDAKPDGYTIGLLGPMIFVVAEAAGQLGKREITRMTWLPRVATTPFAMGVSPQSSIQSIDDIKKVKKVKVPVTNTIIAGNIAFLTFIGAEPRAIMYGGGAEVCLAAMRGDVDFVITTSSTLVRQAEASAGKLIPKVVFAENRLSIAPNLPTIREIGINVPKEILTMMALDAVFVAPYGLPEDVYKILNEAIEKTLRDPDFAKAMVNAKLPVDMLSSEEMRKTISQLSKVVPNHIEAIRLALPK